VSTRVTACVVALVLVVAGTGAAAAATLVTIPSTSARVELACEPGLESMARDLAEVVDASLAEIAIDLAGLPQPRHVRIQLVRDAKTLAEVAPGGRGAPPWAVGVTYPDLGIISISLRRGGQPVDPIATLRHELGHVAIGAALGDNAPHWLHEGFAAQHAREWSWDRVELLSGMAWFGGIVPLDQLDAAFPAGESPASRAYAESYDFVGFLSRRGDAEDGSDEGDRQPFRRFLGELGRGTRIDQAATKAYGKPLRALFDEWKHDLSRRYLFAPLGLIGLALWIVCAVLLWLAWRRRRRQNRARLAQWERDEAIAPPYVPWPGEDPLEHDPEEHERDPRSMN
jgi:hypothetical protein